MTTRTCKTCLMTKDISLFLDKASTRQKGKILCRSCKSEKHRAYYRANSERIKATSRRSKARKAGITREPSIKGFEDEFEALGLNSIQELRIRIELNSHKNGDYGTLGYTIPDAFDDEDDT